MHNYFMSGNMVYYYIVTYNVVNKVFLSIL